MESREENALYEVDRITVTVNYLREILAAATRADLRALSKQPTGGGPE